MSYELPVRTRSLQVADGHSSGLISGKGKGIACLIARVVEHWNGPAKSELESTCLDCERH